jgi:hypothetical protein
MAWEASRGARDGVEEEDGMVKAFSPRRHGVTEKIRTSRVSPGGSILGERLT